MNPTVLDHKTQEFLGLRFYRRKSGYYYSAPPNRQERLQRVVYRAEYGNIPHGWQVHHKDEDKANNGLLNLEALAPLDHHRKHREQKRAVAIARNKAGMPKQTHTCTVCAASYMATVGGKPTRFCSERCEKRARRLRQKEALNVPPQE